MTAHKLYNGIRNLPTHPYMFRHPSPQWILLRARWSHPTSHWLKYNLHITVAYVKSNYSS